MAHVKSAGGKVHQKANVVGKRRGLKVNHGQLVNAGAILVRQLGTKYLPGFNVKVARNFDLIAKIRGIVRFTKTTKNGQLRTRVDIEPTQ